MDDIAEMLGLVSLIVMAAAVATGVFMRYRRVLFGKIHRVIGFITLALAIFHGLTMMLD